MRNLCGVLLFFALTIVFAACGSEPNLIVGEAADAAQPVAQPTPSVADDSAPFEVVPDRGESVGDVNLDDHPLLGYLEPNTFDTPHPGHARFVLIDADGEPARLGSDRFPLAVMNIGAYAGANTAVEYMLSYNNFNQNEFGEIGYGRCRGPWGHFDQQSATEYRFKPGTYPQVIDLDFAQTSEGCGEMPPLTPANIFDGTVELEFAEPDITVVAEDGERWIFRQVPLRSERQRAIDALPTTEAPATTEPPATTTTTEPDPTG